MWSFNFFFVNLLLFPRAAQRSSTNSLSMNVIIVIKPLLFWRAIFFFLLTFIWRFTNAKKVLLSLCDQHIYDTRPCTRPGNFLLTDNFSLSTNTICGKICLRVLSVVCVVKSLYFCLIEFQAPRNWEHPTMSQAAKITLPNSSSATTLSFISWKGR